MAQENKVEQNIPKIDKTIVRPNVDNKKLLDSINEKEKALKPHEIVKK